MKILKNAPLEIFCYLLVWLSRPEDHPKPVEKVQFFNFHVYGWYQVLCVMLLQLDTLTDMDVWTNMDVLTF